MKERYAQPSKIPESGFSRVVGTPFTNRGIVDSSCEADGCKILSRSASPGVHLNSAPPITSPGVNWRRRLAELIPSVTLSVELPFHANGNLFQARTTVSNLVFYGRAATEEEAILKCCKKAVNYIQQHWDPNSNCPREPDRHQSGDVARPLSRRHNTSRGGTNHRNQERVVSRLANNFRSGRQPARNDRQNEFLATADERRARRERELRSEMGSVMEMLDRRTRGSAAAPLVGCCNVAAGGDQVAFPHGQRKAPNASSTGRHVRNCSDEPFGSDAASSLSTSTYVDTDSLDDGSSASDGTFSGLNVKSVPIKNAIMMLNEMFPPPKAPQYKVTSQTGPPNNPTFMMVCTIGNQHFTGEGKSKKDAKLSCSQKAIEAICGHTISEAKYITEQSNPRASCDLDDWMELEGKNPISILNELYPGIQYQLISTSGPSHAPQFVMRASLNEMFAEGNGKSKKDSKLNASKALLVLLHKVGFDPMTGDMISTQQDTQHVAIGHSFADQIGQLVTNKYQSLFGSTTYSKRRVMAGIVISRNFGDVANTGEVVCVSSGTKCINGARLSLEGCVINDSHAEIVTRRCLIVYLYNQLERVAAQQDSIFQEASIPDSGFVYELKEGIEFHLFITTSPCGDARIFSHHESSQGKENKSEATASGVQEQSKEGEQKTDDESANEVQEPANSEESEVVDFNQNVAKLEAYAAEEEEEESDLGVVNVTESGLVVPTITITDFDALGGDDLVMKKPKTRERVKQNDASKGVLRSKIECGMGTVPIGSELHLLTWDGVTFGDRLLTMACCDKILRWNVIGVQGALLTHLIGPIYLSSITVGSKFHPGHMRRALYERIENHLKDLPDPYRLNVPKLYATTSPETRQATKAHDYSVNWVVDSGQPEIVNGSTGKTISDGTSRLSKKLLFEKFLTVSAQLMKESFPRPARYSEVKAQAGSYQEAKRQVVKALVTAGCGHWVDKPVEQDQFLL